MRCDDATSVTTSSAAIGNNVLYGLGNLFVPTVHDDMILLLLENSDHWNRELCHDGTIRD